MSKKKRRHAEVDASQTEAPAENSAAEEPVTTAPDQSIEQTSDQPIPHEPYQHKQKKFKPVFTRVSVDPTRKYHQPESRESWGPNVKGKKFRKEKGKKKRCPNAGLRIDGSVKSVRLDA